MSYYGGGGGFGGYPGGYNQTPGGFGSNAGYGFGGSSGVYTLGTNLPRVDPNNFAGTVHFGPSTAYGGSGYNTYPGGFGGGSNFYPGY